MARIILAIEFGAIIGFVGGVAVIGYLAERDPERWHKLIDEWSEELQKSKEQASD